MQTTENKRLLKYIYEEIAKRNAQPLLDSMADDIQWTAKVYNRKEPGFYVKIKLAESDIEHKTQVVKGFTPVWNQEFVM